MEWVGGGGAVGVEVSGGKGQSGWRGVEWSGEGMDGGADVRRRRGIGRVGLR